jgi:hypothetical protein
MDDESLGGALLSRIGRNTVKKILAGLRAEC